MPDRLRCILAQFNPKVNDIQWNIKQMLEIYHAHHNDDIVIFPEMSLVGYPMEDLILDRSSLEIKVIKAINKLKEATKNHKAALLFGTPTWDNSKNENKPYNAALCYQDGKLIAHHKKHNLPNYSVFDEYRYFKHAETLNDVFEINGFKLSCLICEDTWFFDVAKVSIDAGAEIFISINCSPYSDNKLAKRLDIIRNITTNSKCYMLYLNMFGAQDDLVFDGRSMIVSPSGALEFMAPAFEYSVTQHTFVKHNNKEISYLKNVQQNYEENKMELDYKAIVLGLKDYMGKNGQKKVLIGLSGGIDSALVACIACDALGAENVTTVMLTSEYTSLESIQYAQEQAEILGCKHVRSSIDKMRFAIHETLFDCEIEATGIVAENIQARVRGITLMAMSNATGALLLACCNKSECAVGYATLYGDTCGAFAPIKDLYKTQVYKLSNWRNSQSFAILSQIISRAPTAELRHGQLDVQALPNYADLDLVLAHLIEGEIMPKNINPEIISKVRYMLQNSEFKRRQMPLGPKLTNRAFGKDWRVPITCG